MKREYRAIVDAALCFNSTARPRDVAPHVYPDLSVADYRR